jgi:plastocyanin
MPTRYVIVSILFVALASRAASAQWGDLKIVFQVDGKAPPARKLPVDKDGKVCADPKNPPITSEEFVVGENGGIKDVVVHLVLGKEPLKIHPAYEAAKDVPVELDNLKCRFVPHVALVRTGQTLLMKNSDPVGHNANIQFRENSINVLIPAKGEYPIKSIGKPERLPAGVVCGIHPWMKGLVVVQDHPYMAVSDEQGVLTIENLPAGKHTFQFWQEGVGYVNPSGNSTLRFLKGKVDIEIKSGENDLGVLKVKPPEEKK